MTTGTMDARAAADSWELRSALGTREAYRRTLLDLARRDARIWCCDTDMGGFEDTFARELPDQYVDLGIAEANLMSVSAGLAAAGKIPFANTMASFAALRAGEQVKVDIAYNDLPVHIAASHSGLSGGHFGATHQSLEDLAVMRALPHMTVVVPSDAAMTEQAVSALVDLPGPSYLRLGRKATPAVHPQGARFTLGKAMLLRPGADVTLIACGPYPVLTALAAHERLAALGVRARVLDMATVKPLDVAAVVDAATTTDGLVTVEEHNVLGGLGGAVAETLGEHAPARLRRIGMRDRFCTHVGDHEALLRTYGITEEAVTAAALEVLDVPSATVPEELNTP